jgi:hypothetical protein
MLEALETRTVPSVMSVLNEFDHGPGSLRSIITNAKAGDTIVFTHTVHTITLTTGSLIVNKQLDIEGPANAGLTISGNNASRIFDIRSGANVTLAHLVLTGGKASQEGAINNAGNLTVAHGTITDNQSVGGPGGGAIFNDTGASLTLDDLVLVNNTAVAGNKLDVFGGGLLNQGSATITDSTFQGNQALGGAGATSFAGSQGGAIDNFGSATLTVDNCTFVSNQAISAAGAFFGVGGAIENNGSSTAHISNSGFIDNLATGGAGSTGKGGGLDNQGLGTNVAISNCNFIANQAIGGPGGDGKTTLSQGIGGGVMNAYGTMSISDSLFSGNLAQGGDHSTPTTDNPLTGGGIGGGIANLLGGTLSIINGNLVNNTAQGGATDAGPGGSGIGGGIENSFSFPPNNSASSTLTVTNSVLINNQAIGGLGGPGTAKVPGGLGAGGGIDNSFRSTATITGTTFISNQAIGSDGGDSATGGDGVGGGISNGINVLLGFSGASRLTFTGSSLVANRASGGRGGRNGNGGDGLGGGLAIFAGSSATAVRSLITRNLALAGKKGTSGGGNSDGTGVGGGVYNLGTFSFDVHTLINKNGASTSNNDIFP